MKTNLIIFGASGELAKHKLLPAVEKLPKNVSITGFARSPKPRYFKHEYIRGQYDNPEDYEKLKIHKNIITIAYLSVPPVAFAPIIENLGKLKKKSDLRIIIEKPFGTSEKSAHELYKQCQKYFEDDDVYLLDHYLGKSSVQNILELRHSNKILNLLLKGKEIANIQISNIESVGIENRLGYFDEVGTIKDVFQSHLLQVLALLTMQIPVNKTTENIQRERQNILSALNFHKSKNNIVVGQHKSYPVKSKTETYVALKLYIDRQDWYNVPIFLRTGKKLRKKQNYISVEFKPLPFQKATTPNRLDIILGPEEKIAIHLSTSTQQFETIDSIACEGPQCLPDHTNLLLDVINKDHMHFLSFPEIIAMWHLTDRIHTFAQKQPLHKYKDGGKGPKDDLINWHEL